MSEKTLTVSDSLGGMWQSFACKYVLHFWEEIFPYNDYCKNQFSGKNRNSDNNIMPRGVSAKEEGQKKMQIRWTRKLSEYFFFLWKKNRNLLKSSWLSSPVPSKKVIVISTRCQDSQQCLYQKLQNHAKSSNLKNNSYEARYSSNKICETGFFSTLPKNLKDKKLNT